MDHRDRGRSFARRRPSAPQTYAEATHASPYWIVRYAHQQRATVAVDMMLATRPAVVADWGTGDGLVIERLLDDPRAPELILAFEPGQMVHQLRERLAQHPDGDRVKVCHTLAEVPWALEGRTVDVMACLGVLEHLPVASRACFYDAAERHLSPGGCLVIDVPVEIGPALLVKELGRRVLKRRPPEYSTRALLARTLGRTERDPGRFADFESHAFIGTHRDFDHRHLIEEVEALGYRVTERRNTPVGWAPAPLCNQEVIFRAVPGG